MNSRVLDRMQARARAVVTRAAVRSWSYRQRNLAAGVWFRLRRVLADAKAAYVISEEQARELMAEGHVPLTCGDEVAPRTDGTVQIGSSRLPMDRPNQTAAMSLTTHASDGTPRPRHSRPVG